jgi:hypothetical protein
MQSLPTEPSEKAIRDLPGWLVEHKDCLEFAGVTTLVDGSGLLCVKCERTWTLEAGDGPA